MTVILDSGGTAAGGKARVVGGRLLVDARTELTENGIVEGPPFSVGVFEPALAVNDTLALLIQTGAREVVVNWSIMATRTCTISLFEKATFSNPGVDVVAYERERTLDDAQGSSFSRDPTIIDTGTELTGGFVQGAAGPQLGVGVPSAFAEITLEANTSYLLQVTNDMTVPGPQLSASVRISLEFRER